MLFSKNILLHQSKSFQLWDALLLADSSFPMFVGVSILTDSRLRELLMRAQFNDAILLFSDLPDVPIDRVVGNAVGAGEKCK